MQAKKIKALPKTKLATPLDHSLQLRRPLTWRDKEDFALLRVPPPGGEGAVRQVRFAVSHTGKYWGVKVNGTYRECVSLGEDEDHAWEHFQLWLTRHGPAVVADLAAGRTVDWMQVEVFCAPRPRQLTLMEV